MLSVCPDTKGSEETKTHKSREYWCKLSEQIDREGEHFMATWASTSSRVHKSCPKGGLKRGLVVATSGHPSTQLPHYLHEKMHMRVCSWMLHARSEHFIAQWSWQLVNFTKLFCWMNYCGRTNFHFLRAWSFPKLHALVSWALFTAGSFVREWCLSRYFLLLRCWPQKHKSSKNGAENWLLSFLIRAGTGCSHAVSLQHLCWCSTYWQLKVY